MSDKSPFVDRRRLISGLWAEPASADARSGEIASILVQTRPERIVEVEEAILGLPGCEVHGRDARGKLVIVVDAPSAGVIGSTLNTIAMTKGVLSAALVFHAIEAAVNANTETAP